MLVFKLSIFKNAPSLPCRGKSQKNLDHITLLCLGLSIRFVSKFDQSKNAVYKTPPIGSTDPILSVRLIIKRG
ncbi:MAG: hypothetical protein AUJ19_04525 [Parcubacteria group bacterium CG1_02_58_44]|nr:MAG: hypothetical protein AUJ19_04525 [Parcubacteria group bacterium CG1_02_58_44]